MKQLSLGIIMFVYLSITTLFAQTSTYYNEWIDYSLTYYKIKVAEDGVYRIPASQLQAKGLPLTSVGYQLYHKGRLQPLFFSADGDLGPNDYIEFVGRKNDGEFDVQLYQSANHQPVPENNLFSDISSYYLVWDETLTNNLHFRNQINNLDNTPSPESHYIHQHKELFPAQHNNGEPLRTGSDNAYPPEFGKGEGFASKVFDSDLQGGNFYMQLPHVYDAGENAKIQFNLIGASEEFGESQDHPVEIYFNDELDLETWYDGYDILPVSYEFPVSRIIKDTWNILFVKALRPDIRNKNRIGYIYVDYPREFNFEGKDRFELSLADNRERYIEFENFDGGTGNVTVYDLTNNWRFEAVYDAARSVYQLNLPQGNDIEAARNLFIFNNNNGFGAVEQLTTVQFTDFSALENQGNYLIISHPQLMAGEVNQVERYKVYRESQEGRGYNVTVVSIEELYDQFAWGISKHPLAIKKFISYAIDNWEVDPEYLLLIGKSTVYSKFTDLGGKVSDLCLVPTFGVTPSDVMLTSSNNFSYDQRIATGRIPAITSNDVRKYLDKVIQYESLQQSKDCSIDNRLWMKDAMHIAGGSNLLESEQFTRYLDNYKALFEGEKNGGRVVFTYNKNTDAVIDLQAELDPYINNGLSVITFFGHSSNSGFSVGLKNAEDYRNFGKFPFIMTGSCLVGNIHVYSEQGGEPVLSLSENYTMADNLGSIGFLATATLGYPGYLNQYLSRVYENFCGEMYNQPVGDAIQATILDIYTDPNSGSFIKNTVQEYTYAGDPAIIINSWKEPELVLEEAGVFFEPALLSTDIDSFDVKIALRNFGQANGEMVWISIDREYPDGSTAQVALREYPIVPYLDTLTIKLPTGDKDLVEGANNFTVSIDYENNVAEDCEDNNIITKELFVLSDLLIPLAPCDFSIVGGGQDVTLFAATGQPLLEAVDYVLEIDTTSLFSNPVSTEVNSEAGIIEWQPDIDFQDNTVYYWRASKKPENNEPANWKQSSFIYLNEPGKGWNQSHYYQFAQNRFSNYRIDSVSRLFDHQFEDNLIRIVNDYDNYGDNGIVLNGEVLKQGSCLHNTCKGGIGFMVFKSGSKLEPIYATRASGSGVCSGIGNFGNSHCQSSDISLIEFNTADADQLEAMVQFIEEEVKVGDYVVVMGVNKHRMNSLASNFNNPLLQFLEELGIPEVQTAGISENQSFILFGRKDIPNYPSRLRIGNIDPNAGITKDSIAYNAIVKGAEGDGRIYSPIIGPAKNWESLHWALKTDDDTALETQILVYGLDELGNSVLLKEADQLEGLLSLADIDATQYPFIQLEATITDSITYTKAQLDYWRVYFERVPELAISTNDHLIFKSDTLQQGGLLELEMGLWNVEENTTDSVLIAYSIIANNVLDTVIYVKEAPIPSGEMIIAKFAYNAVGLSGNNRLKVEVNPNFDQQEKRVFNNLLLFDFFVLGDIVNPVLDVTFDGRHIIDGELISAEPEIVIQLKDDSRFLALDNLSDFELKLYMPDENGEPSETVTAISLNSEDITFIPASSDEAETGNNKATLIYTPSFELNGLYLMEVQAKDRSGNYFASQSYKTTFEIIKESTITHVLNYPNPFTSSTRFAFQLTGTVVPDFFKIQIMTPTGRVVKEINKEELGPIHIGQNLTDYAWDGTDNYGNLLANGVYLYRVVAKVNGTDINPNFQEIDRLFRNEVGKMYLMR